MTEQDARETAGDWVATQIMRQGQWGGSPSASVTEVSAFKRGTHTLGYFCHVEPSGCVIVSLRRELAAVKFYSETSSFDPLSNEGIADVIKLWMENEIRAIELRIGPIETASPDDVSRILEIDYRQSWQEILPAKRGGASSQTVGPLLSSAWHQEDPYNELCPDLGCMTFNSRALVGCVATAMAQIMRYWAWPPGPDYRNMNDLYSRLPGQAKYLNERSDTCTSAEILAVAELCRAAADTVAMDFGCVASAAYVCDADGPDALDAFEDHFKYNTGADCYQRSDYASSEDWFALIQSNINVNRPLNYRIATSDTTGHSFVIDGWKIDGSLLMLGVNYGWGPSNNIGWYSVDALPSSHDRNDEAMIVYLRPDPCMGTWVHGSYAAPTYPYRYFDQNCTGDSAVFSEGQNLQFLSGVHLACTSANPLHSIRMSGTGYAPVRAYSASTRNGGIRLTKGHLSIRRNGEIVIH